MQSSDCYSGNLFPCLVGHPGQEKLRTITSSSSYYLGAHGSIVSHYRKLLVCRLGITDGKDVNPDGKEFAVRKYTAKSDGKDKSAKNSLPSAIFSG